MIKLGNNDITLKVGSADVSAAYLGSTLVYTSTPPEPKWIATYTGGTTSSAECDASSAITENEISKGYLQSVEIGQCVTSIGASAFTRCDYLEEVTIPDSVTSISSGAFEECRILNSIDIPDSVQTIGGWAFRDCGDLRSVKIGSGVTAIANFAFDGCRNLTSIIIEATTPPMIGNNSVFGSYCPIYVPCESINAYKTASGWSTYASRITCIEPVFNGKWKATYTGGTTSSAECDASSTAILTGEIDKTDLVSLVIGDCVRNLGTSALRSATTLSDVTLPSGLSGFGNNAFAYCVSLANINDIPSGVTELGSQAFRNCSGLTSITLPSGLTTINSQAFYECNNANINIPDSVTSIGTSAFSYCYALTSVNIPSGITSISDWTFRGCSGLASVTIPSGVTSIGNDAFAQCTNLKSVICYATTPPTLATGAFNNNKSGRIIYVPAASVTTYQSASGWSAYASRIQAIP